MWTFLPSGGLRVTGADRVDFVQGQMTGDLRGAATPGMVACAFLNVRGQIEQFARAYKRADDVYLHLDAGQAAPLLARLKRYVIFDQVELQDVSDDLRTVHIWNAAGLPGWNMDGPDAQSFELGGGVVLAGRVNRTGTPGVDLHYLARHEAAVLAALDGEEASLDTLDAARVRAGIPDIARDGFLGVLPQEVGLNVDGPLPAISYRKGCYVGQEIMARLEARGNTRYHLAQLAGDGWDVGAAITHAGKVVGQAGLNAGGLGLARLRKDLPEDAEVEVNGIPARLQSLNARP
ncbi:folate-binding protein [Deinococcus sp. ZS9-10]|uniref:Folate-binding protein n=1 Tax=Deinococcus arenicola TaxID=2994950 RepID=A0ABU4DRV8_9DEIO|nr:folate-binding protein [Deinococcus sp. ZS9-10]MDV6375166.1 folate-binding protein [Deinococcus sp. ZS9-10]